MSTKVILIWTLMSMSHKPYVDEGIGNTYYFVNKYYASIFGIYHCTVDIYNIFMKYALRVKMPPSLRSYSIIRIE
jgi:hypothetical protein